MSSSLKVMFFSHETDPPKFLSMTRGLEDALMQLGTLGPVQYGTLEHGQKTQNIWEAQVRTRSRVRAADVLQHLSELERLEGTLHVNDLSRRLRPVHDRDEAHDAGCAAV